MMLKPRRKMSEIPAIQIVLEEDGSEIFFCKIRPCPRRGLWAPTEEDILDHLQKDHGYVPLDKWMPIVNVEQKKCPKCGHDLEEWVDQGYNLYRPLFREDCPHCGWSRAS